MTQYSTYMEIYKTFADAEVAICKLHDKGFEMKCLSVIGRDDGTNRHMAACYNMGDGLKCHEKSDDAWTRIQGLLSGWGFFWSIGSGLVHVGGPLVEAMVKAQTECDHLGGMTVFSSALSSIGINADSIIQYEDVLLDNQLLLCAHGTSKQMDSAYPIFIEAQPIHGALLHEADDKASYACGP